MGEESYSRGDSKDIEKRWPAMATSSADSRSKGAIGLCAEYEVSIGVKVRDGEIFKIG